MNNQKYGMLFDTSSDSHYYFDTGTGKVISCTNKEKAFIKKVLFVKSVKGHCQQIVLELTEGCNLRCEYCVYNEHHPDFRGYSNRNMSFETAKKSIDLVLGDYEGEEFALSFYGGEPLVNFPLLKECIEYTRTAYHIRK